MDNSVPLFWPADVPFEKGGYCYGWTQPLLCVAGVVQADSEANAERFLRDAVASSSWSPFQETAGVQNPVVLGRCDSTLDNSNELASVRMYIEKGGIQRGDLRFIHYRRLKRDSMRFYTLDSRELDILPSHQETSTHAPRQSASVLESDFTRPQFSSMASLDLTVLSQLNLAHSLADIVGRTKITSERPTGNVSQQPQPSTSKSLWSLPHSQLSDAPTGVYSVAARQLRSMLKDISATVEQLDVRAEQGHFVFAHIPTICYDNNSVSVHSISRYIKFYNCIWLVLNDVIVGVAFGSFLCENRVALSRLLEYCLQHYLVDGMQHALLWLNNWPAGLKLNTELSAFYCHTFLGAISAWSGFLRYVSPHLPEVIWVAGTMGGFGMTMVVALLSDALSLLTAHLYVCYLISTTVFRQQLGLAGSLWNLFRGKRYNVLRDRLDSWDYDVDQLLLGTILFTLVAFLYPTVLTYHALFAVTRLVIIMLHAALDTITALLNHFPLFALMLRVKDPLRLPGSITFELSRTHPGVLVLKNQPAPLSSIFIHYAHLLSRLSSHYNPLRLLRQLMAGTRLSPIPRSLIRFSMIAHPHDRPNNRPAGQET